MNPSSSQPDPMVRRQPSRLRRWARRIGVGAAALLLTAIVAGAAYQIAGQYFDARRYPAPGRMVEVGGHRLHLYSSGAGAIPIVLEAGVGGGVLDWYQVQPELAKISQVVSYDRAGVGWSEPGPEPRDSAQIAQELHTLLSKAGIQAPYVLVGHSLGGLDVQLYAMKYPDEVAGLVLVDSSHEGMATRPELLPPRVMRSPTLVRAIGSLGLIRFLFNLQDRDTLRRPSELPPRFVADLSHESSMLTSHTGNLVTWARELAALPTSAAQVRATPMQLGDKPLFVLTRCGEPNPTPKRKTIETIWNQWQEDLASRSQNSKHVVAEHSGHYIHQDQPDLVIAAIEQTVSAARTKRRL